MSKINEGYKEIVEIHGDLITLKKYKLKGKRREQDVGKKVRKEKVEGSEEDKENKDRKAKTRVQKQLREVINNNIGQYKGKDLMVTLTYRKEYEREFSKEVAEISKKELKEYIRKLNVLGEVRYTSILETQSKKSKNIHYHLIMYGIEIEEEYIRSNWEYGDVHIIDIKEYNNEEVEDIGYKLGKYLSKEKVEGVKKVTNSRNLRKGVKIEDKEEVEHIKRALEVESPEVKKIYNSNIKNSFIDIDCSIYKVKSKE